jgi:hypothetical protein
MTEQLEPRLERALRDQVLPVGTGMTGEEIVRLGTHRRRRRRRSRWLVAAAAALVVTLGISASGRFTRDPELPEAQLPRQLNGPAPTPTSGPTPISTWGPWRPGIDWNDPKQQVSLTAPVLNAFVNTPTYGDERQFVTARKVGSRGSFATVVKAQVGHEYEIRSYIHNGADPSVGASGTATGVSLYFGRPVKLEKKLELTGYLSAGNVSGVSIDSSVVFEHQSPIGVSYVYGSTRLIYPNSRRVVLRDGVFGRDVFLPGNQLAAGIDKAIYITFRVRIIAPGLKIVHSVSQASANPGDELEHRITVRSVGTLPAEGVIAFVKLNEAEKFIPGSVRWHDQNHRPTPLPVAALDQLNLTNFGTYSAAEGFEITFRTKVLRRCDHVRPAVATARADGVDDVEATARVRVECKH